MRTVARTVLLIAVLGSACGGARPFTPDDGGSGDSVEPADANGTADSDDAAGCDPSLTYASFGMAFLDTYCVRCHGFDQQSAQTAGAAIVGAAGTGTFMPPVDPRPSDQERQELTAWINCGAP
ncbi:MAG TPA: hypothetical protein VIF57_18670 [Polyangia bacterium]